MSGRRRSRRFQFSIGALVLLMTGTAIVFSLSHYLSKVVDFPLAGPALSITLFDILLCIIAWGAIYAIALVLRSAVRGLGRLKRKVGIDKSRPYRFVLRHVIGPLQRLRMRPGLAANHRAVSLINDRRLDEAIAELDRAVELEGRRAAVPYCNRGNAWYRKGDFDRALADAESSLRLNSRYAPAYRLRALVRIAKQQYDRAIEDCDAALQAGGEDGVALYYRGIALQCKRCDEQALHDFDSAIAQNPSLLDAYLRRACLWINRGQFVMARSDIEYVLQREPKNAEAILLRGVVSARQGLTENALEELNFAITLRPKDYRPYVVRGAAWDQAKEHRRAITEYDEALRVAPGTAEVYCHRGLSYFRIGDDEHALADYAEAIRLEPSFHLAYNNRGYLYMMRGQYEKARSDLEKAIELAPRHPNAHKNLAWLMATCPAAEFRNGATAIEHARLALELAAQSDPAWFDILAAAYAETGDYYAAIAWQKRTIEKCDEPEELSNYEARLALYRKRQPHRDGPQHS